MFYNVRILSIGILRKQNFTYLSVEDCAETPIISSRFHLCIFFVAIPNSSHECVCHAFYFTYSRPFLFHSTSPRIVRFCLDSTYITFHSTSPFTKCLFPLDSIPGYTSLLAPSLASLRKCNAIPALGAWNVKTKKKNYPIRYRLLGQNIWLSCHPYSVHMQIHSCLSACRIGRQEGYLYMYASIGDSLLDPEQAILPASGRVRRRCQIIRQCFYRSRNGHKCWSWSRTRGLAPRSLS